jgi:hypothetical protein
VSFQYADYTHTADDTQCHFSVVNCDGVLQVDASLTEQRAAAQAKVEADPEAPEFKAVHAKVGFLDTAASGVGCVGADASKTQQLLLWGVSVQMLLS